MSMDPIDGVSLKLCGNGIGLSDGGRHGMSDRVERHVSNRLHHVN